MAAAADIDDAILLCADAIADVSYDGIFAGSTESLDTQMGIWIAGMFQGTAGIFIPGIGVDGNQRTVRDWYGPHLLAREAILGTGDNDSTPVGTSTCIDAVFRVLNAVKFATAAGRISTAQEDATVALFNTAWC
jgi:hypothetical protein